MSLTFTFALSQQQTFELRCDKGSRPLPQAELKALIDLCEQQYYADPSNHLPELRALGHQLYHWLDGPAGWLRQALDETDQQTLYLDLTQTSEAQGLNPETERVALGLAHLPWELLHDGEEFLLRNQTISVLPVRSVRRRQGNGLTVQNRPLRLLFMATSPEDITPVLSFEQEEANILQATQDQPLALIVEESGSVEELGNLVKSYSEGYFDVFHLTGHGLIYTAADYGHLLAGSNRQIPDHTPCFITEDDFGKVQLTTVSDLAKAFRGRWPRVVFLSGCHTGQVPNRGTVPSMAQALVKAGASVVLGWARPVYDRTGIVAAQALYRALATGDSIEDAVQAAQREMVEQKCSDWHLLRIYQDSQALAGLVTPLRTPQREKLRFTPPENEFLDQNRQVKVASRAEFVGRRRPLQRCLRALRETSDQIGVFIGGMGGLGKSTLAARLCTRVQTQQPDYQQVVLIGPLDETGLLNQLSGKYERFGGVPELLNQPNVSLKGRLQNFFEVIEQSYNQPLLLVLDDFEQNIPAANIADGSLRITTDAYQSLAAICAALADNAAVSRLIVTCRYLQPDTLPPHRLHLESLVAMSETDLRKKCRLLATEELQRQAQNERILAIADGNPRLLEWLVAVLQKPNLDHEQLLTRLEQTQQEFRENILAATLLAALTPAEVEFLAQLSVFQLPVSIEIIDAVVADTNSLAKLVSLSLLEQTGTQLQTYRVTRILASLLADVLDHATWQTAYQQAAQQLYQVWWEASDSPTEAQALEIVRLGLLADAQEITASVGARIATRWVNQSRFLEAVQLCYRLLQKFEDYRILGTIARAEVVIGRVGDALEHYQQALNLCPEEDLYEKSATLNNMARVIAAQGEIERLYAGPHSWTC
ncbi:MAG: CHAT domain-containing protein [Cyanothece sp. SIO1E1]|nr:CHAT domain-containing protein [Cyanothece sp. SIO1E1]